MTTTNASGRFALRGPLGRCHVRYRLDARTVSVRARAPGVEFALSVRGQAPATFRVAVRRKLEDCHATVASWGVWDLQPRSHGDASLRAPFTALLEPIGLTEDADGDRARSRGRVLARRLLDALAREVMARCDPRARALACASPEELRLWIYQRLVADRTGRLGQMVAACPGLLTLAYTFSRHGRAGREWVDAILGGIVSGRRLRDLLDAATAASLEPEVLGGWARGAAALRLRTGSLAHFEATFRARRLLVARARARVRPWDLMQVPPAAFAPEDIPRSAGANACWYAVQGSVQAVVGDVCEPELRLRLARYTSAHWKLLARRTWPRGLPWTGAGEVFIPELRSLVQRFVRFSRATGRLPPRRGSGLAYLDACERWALEHADDTGLGRLARLLGRIPELGLGEVTAVHALGDDAGLARLERIRLPRAPLPAKALPGLVAEPLSTPEALALEGDRMRSCVASWLPRVLAGGCHLYSVRIASTPLTVAVERAGGTYRLVEARQRDNAKPTYAQLRMLELWVRGLAGQQPSGTAQGAP